MTCHTETRQEDRMFKWRTTVLGLSLSAVMGAGGASAAPIPTLLSPGSLTIGTDPTYPPFIFLKGKTLSGFEVEVMNEVARRRTDGPIHDERGMTSTEMAVLAVGIVILAGLVIAGIRAFVMSKIGSMG